jgi:hypothetical protein
MVNCCYTLTFGKNEKKYRQRYKALSVQQLFFLNNMNNDLLENDIVIHV